MTPPDTQGPVYQVFVQEQPSGPFLDAGSVHAPDAEMALLNARDVFARRPGVFALGVVPAAAIYSKTRQELGSFPSAQAAIYSKTRQELKETTPGRAASLLAQDERLQSKPAPPLALETRPGSRAGSPFTEAVAAGGTEKYLASCKPTSSGTQTLLGTVEAASPTEALRLAIEAFSNTFPPERPPFAWWVFLERLVTRNDPQDAPSLFSPALGKPFRLSTDYRVVTAMRDVIEGREEQ